MFVFQKELRWVYPDVWRKLRYLTLSNAFFIECLLQEVNVKGQVDYAVVSYLSPSQTSSQFNDFFYLILRDSLMILIWYNLPLLLFYVISMSDQNHGGVMT